MSVDWMHVLRPDLPLLEKAVRTLAVYLFLLVALRLAGKRELGQLNPFDLVVLLLLANTLQNAVIGPDDSVTGGLFGAALLLAANWLVVRFLFRHPRLERWVEGDPDVLVRDGRVVEKALRRNVVTHDELRAAARRQGIERLSEVECARLEVGGAITFSLRRPTVDDQRHREVMARLEAMERRLAAPGGGAAGGVAAE